MRNESDPYLCFRRRESKPIRKTRRTDQQSIEKLRKLRMEMESARSLLEMVSRREKVRKESLVLEHMIFDQRCKVREYRKNLGIKDDDDDVQSQKVCLQFLLTLSLVFHDKCIVILVLTGFYYAVVFPCANRKRSERLERPVLPSASLSTSRIARPSLLKKTPERIAQHSLASSQNWPSAERTMSVGRTSQTYVYHLHSGYPFAVTTHVTFILITPSYLHIIYRIHTSPSWSHTHNSASRSFPSRETANMSRSGSVWVVAAAFISIVSTPGQDRRHTGTHTRRTPMECTMVSTRSTSSVLTMTLLTKRT